MSAIPRYRRRHDDLDRVSARTARAGPRRPRPVLPARNGPRLPRHGAQGRRAAGAPGVPGDQPGRAARPHPPRAEARGPAPRRPLLTAYRDVRPAARGRRLRGLGNGGGDNGHRNLGDGPRPGHRGLRRAVAELRHAHACSSCRWRAACSRSPSPATASRRARRSGRRRQWASRTPCGARTPAVPARSPTRPTGSAAASIPTPGRPAPRIPPPTRPRTARGTSARLLRAAGSA